MVEVYFGMALEACTSVLSLLVSTTSWLIIFPENRDLLLRSKGAPER